MKKTFIAFILILSIIFSAFSVCGQDYTSFLVSEGVISGDEKGFRENDFVSRSEFVKMVNRAFKLDNMSQIPFPDVSENDWFYKDVSVSYNYGYIKGDEKGRFNPYDFITRQEAITIIGRLTGSYKYTETTFKDNASIEEWAKGSVAALNENKIISGDEKGNFNPDDNLTRYESFVIFTRLLDREVDGIYLISSPFDLYLLNIYPYGSFSLTNDLDLSGKNLPLPLCVDEFNGYFNGNGNKISDLSTLNNDYSLFDTIGKEGKVSSVILVCSRYFASIAKTNNGRIENSAHTSFPLKNQNYQNTEVSGGIASKNNGIIESCYISSDLKINSPREIGGICGINNGTVSNSFSTSSGSDNAYALVAYNNSLIKNSFSTGNIPAVKESKGTLSLVSYTQGDWSLGNKVTDTKLFNLYSYPFKKDAKFPFPVLSGINFSYGENKEEFGGGSGTASDPYIVSNASHFTNINKYPNAYFSQSKDIDMNEVYDFVPVGNEITPFTGEYNGNGYKIKNLYIENNDLTTPALFGINAGVIKNINLDNAYIKSFNSAASVVYENYGLCSFVSSNAVIDAPYSGGIIYKGYDVSNIVSCVFNGKLNSYKCAGIAYGNSGHISNSLFKGNINSSAGGGIAYFNDGEVFENCSFGTFVSMEYDDIVLNNQGTSVNCYYGNKTDNENCYLREQRQIEFKESFPELDFSMWEIGYVNNEFVIAPHNMAKLLTDISENYTDFAGGNGTVRNPYKIATPLQFKNIQFYPSSAFVLINDLDMSYITGKNGQEYVPFDFEGILDGNMFSIFGINYSKDSSGIFKTNNGVIKNLTVKITSYGKENIFSLCETNNKLISGVLAEAFISGDKAGGITLTNNGIIYNCAVQGNINAVITAGGISNINNGIIKDTLVSASLTGENSLSSLFGVSGGNGQVNSSFVTGDLFFKNGIGSFAPISENYTNSYYFDRYNEKSAGNVNFSNISDKNYFAGFDFDNVWTFNSLNVPVLKNFENLQLTLPKPFESGDGSDLNPYVLSSFQDLYNIRLFPHANFVLSQDINCMALTDEISIYNNGNLGFAPITDFYGTIDGNNNSIIGLEILYSQYDDIGFIKNLHGSIINLDFYDSRVEGKSNVGMVSATNNYLIDNVSVSVSRIGAADGVSGGITGSNKGEITNSFNRSDVFSAYKNGGIAGDNSGTIINCSNFGGIITNSYNENKGGGGIAGYNSGNITASYNSGNVMSYSDSHTASSGGIAGENDGHIINCYNISPVSAKSSFISYAGGICGIAHPNSYISDVYNVGYVLCDAKEIFNGALIGSGQGIIQNGYYDNTLNTSFGSDNFSRAKVHSLSPDKMYDLNCYDNFSQSKWTMENTLPYPQLVKNPHKKFALNENIRDFAGGDGSAENPYKIMTPKQLDNVRKYLGSTFILLANIDMSAYCETDGFAPIGDNVFVFYGNFIGNGKTISGIKQENLEKGGLFTQNNGEIHNLATSGFSINASVSGNIAAINSGLIYGCINVSDIYASADNALSGGIAGLNKTSGMIIYSINSSTVSASGNSSQAGGICYGNYGIVAGSFNSGDYVFSEGNTLSMAGGISSFNYGTISDCYSNADIYSTGISGGITGTNTGNLINCYTTANEVFGKTSGGIAGNGQNAFFSGCYYPSDKINVGLGDGANDGIKGVKTEDLYIMSTFENFDFENMWIMIEGYCPLILETIG